MKVQFAKYIEMINSWTEKADRQYLTRTEGRYELHDFLFSKVNHFNVLSCFSQTQWHQLDSLLAPILCKILQISNHFLWKFLHNKILCYNMPLLWNVQKNAIMTFIVGHLCMKSEMRILFKIKIEYAQIECGSLLKFWKLDYTIYSPTVTNSWVKKLWKYIFFKNSTFLTKMGAENKFF